MDSTPDSVLRPLVLEDEFKEYADEYKALQQEQQQIFRDKQKIIQSYSNSGNPVVAKYISAAKVSPLSPFL